MADIIHIACATDINYLPHCAAMLRSVRRHMPAEDLCVHIVHDGVAASDRAMLEGCVPKVRIEWHDALPVSDLATPQIGHISSATYLRLQLDRLIAADIARVLYLDIDMIVTKSLRPLWRQDLCDKSIAAVADAWIDPELFAKRYGLPSGAYFNAGMLLLDLDRIRGAGSFTKTLDIIAKSGNTLEFSDQDALNLAFWNDWQAVDKEWNFQRIHTYDRPLRDIERDMGGVPAIIHFTESLKPWKRAEWHPYRWLYWRNLMGTPFFRIVRQRERITAAVLLKSWAKFAVARKIR